MKMTDINDKMIDSEENFLKQYDPTIYERPVGVPSDIVIFTITAQEQNLGVKSLPIRNLKIMLIKRKGHPEKGKWAIPGGFSSPNETLLEAAKRELKEETGVDGVHIEQFGIYDTPKRDARGWVISVAHFALVNEKYLEKRKAADDAEDVQLFHIEDALKMDLAFDHKKIIKDALNKIREKMLTTNLAKEFLPEEFTLAELKQVIQTVEPSFNEEMPNLKRKLTATKSRIGILELALDNSGKQKKSNQYSQHPAQLYKFTDYIPSISIYS